MPLIFFYLLCFASSLFVQDVEKPIVVVSASYNNAEVYQKQLDSIFNQDYTNWRMIYIDDHSSDNTADLVEAYARKKHREKHLTLIRNTQRRRHLPNQYDAIHSCKPHEIIVIVDGDDHLAHDHVFETINQAYQAGAWLTYGQFWYLKKNRIGICKQLPKNILTQGLIREHRPWQTSHMRTYYAGLFQKIRKDDLMHNNEWLPMCADVATMLPMIEMAGEHVTFIPDILYNYNDNSALNFFHTQAREQRAIEDEIRSRPRYAPLNIPPYED